MILDVKIIYPFIYKPDQRGRYRIFFEYDGSKLTDEGINPKEKSGLYGASSGYAPRIDMENNDYDSLVKLFQVLDARNIGRDMLFKDVRAKVDVKIYEFKQEKGLSIESILVNMKELCND